MHENRKSLTADHCLVNAISYSNRHIRSNWKYKHYNHLQI